MRNDHATVSMDGSGNAFWPSLVDTFDYHHPSWPDDSFWTFRKEQTEHDIILASNAVADVEMEYDPDEERRIRRSGGKYKGKAVQKTKLSGRDALIVQHSVEWRGSAFPLPTGYRFRDGRPSPFAGRMPPCEREYILERRPSELQDIADYLEEVFKDPTFLEGVDNETFPAASSDPHGPAREQGAEEIDAFSAGPR